MVAITAFSLSGIESDSFLRYDGLRSLTHTSRMALVSLGTNPMSVFASMFFMWAQQFSIGLRSRELPGQSMVLMLFVSKNVLIFLEAWQGAPSWRKYYSYLCISMEGRRWSSSTFLYRSLFIVTLLGRK